MNVFDWTRQMGTVFFSKKVPAAFLRVSVFPHRDHHPDLTLLAGFA
jgi:hypothetical protein